MAGPRPERKLMDPGKEKLWVPSQPEFILEESCPPSRQVVRPVGLAMQIVVEFQSQIV